MVVTEDNKKIAKTILNAFGGNPRVFKYWDENNASDIDVLSVENSPDKSITSYATIGLSDYSIGYTVEDKSLRTEIIGVNDSENECFPNIISTCSFNVINSNYHIFHGEIFRDVISMYHPNCEMKHILFSSPYLWENLHSLTLSDKKIAWLLAIPISTNEMLFAETDGTEALESLFEEKNINIFDLKRKSIL